MLGFDYTFYVTAVWGKKRLNCHLDSSIYVICVDCNDTERYSRAEIGGEKLTVASFDSFIIESLGFATLCQSIVGCLGFC